MSEQPDLSSLTGSPGQKRKRDPDSPSLSRNKRPAPAAHMSADTASFIESAIEATHVAATNGVNVADFNALQQAAAADHHDHHEHHEHHEQHEHHEHHEPPDPSNATSTAQAALGMYPTLHVPPSTEEQFAAQAAAEADHDNSFNPDVPPPDGLMDASPITSAPQPVPTNGIQHQPPPRYQTSVSNPKPTVGSEEWHKMRKDNHKEGKFGNSDLGRAHMEANLSCSRATSP